MGYLIQMRGPESYRTPIARGVLHNYASSSVRSTSLGTIVLVRTKPLQMIQALQFRAKNFLDDPEWRTRPWIHFEKDYHYRLIEHGIELGGLIEELDSSGHREGNLGLLGIVNFLARFSQVDHHLDEWFQEFQESAPSPLYTVTSPPSTPTAGGFDNTTFFEFPRLQLAVVTTHYWGIKIVLCSIVNAIALSLSRPQLAQGYSALDPGVRESMEQIIVEHDRERCVDLATKIMRTTPYCFAENMGLMAAQQSIFPMRAAMFLLERYPGDELDWCKALYSQFQEKKGLKYATEIGKVAGGYALDQQVTFRQRIEEMLEAETEADSPSRSWVEEEED